MVAQSARPQSAQHIPCNAANDALTRLIEVAQPETVDLQLLHNAVVRLFPGMTLVHSDYLRAVEKAAWRCGGAA